VKTPKPQPQPDYFAEAWKRTLGHEINPDRTYSNDPADRGGATRYGITERVARRWGYKGDMRDLPLELAEKIARLEYWEGPGFHRIAEVSPAIAFELFEENYNMRYGFAGESLQRVLNGLNRDEDYPDLKVDGKCGSATRDALQRFIAKRGTQGEAVLLGLLNGLQAAEYLRIVESNDSQRKFLYGWATRTRST
jgi:lysozyme family protein